MSCPHAMEASVFQIVNILVKSMFKNPMSIWLRWLASKIYFEFKFRENHLLVGYMSRTSNCQFGNYNTIYSNVTLINVSLNDFTYISDLSRLMNTNIGKFCCIGPEVLAGLGKHPTRNFVSSHPSFFSTQKQTQISFVNQSYFEESVPTKIGNDVWIGARVIIIDGVSIGDGAIVAAGSIVTTDVPAYAVVGGVPAKVLRYRFDQGQIDFLKDFKWWDRDVEWLRLNTFRFLNIGAFIDGEKNGTMMV